MTQVVDAPGSGRPGVAEQLVAEFAGSLPAAAVAEAVRTAREELSGQVPPAAMDELVHRLVGHRLRDGGRT